MKILVAAILSVMFFSEQVSACSCGPWNAALAMENASGIYVAIPLENSRPLLPSWPTPFPRRPRLNKTPMKLVKAYKGNAGENFTMYHDPQTGTSCEFNFQAMSGVYVIMTYNVLGREVTDACAVGAISPNNSMVTQFLTELPF